MIIEDDSEEAIAEGVGNVAADTCALKIQLDTEIEKTKEEMEKIRQDLVQYVKGIVLDADAMIALETGQKTLAFIWPLVTGNKPDGSVSTRTPTETQAEAVEWYLPLLMFVMLVSSLVVSVLVLSLLLCC